MQQTFKEKQNDVIYATDTQRKTGDVHGDHVEQ